MRLVPSDPTQLDALFQIFCECAELNPEPIEEVEEEHNWIFSADQLGADIGKATVITIGGLVAGVVVGCAIENWLQVDIVPCLGIHSPTTVSVNELAMLEQKNADDRILKLADEHMKERKTSQPNHRASEEA